MSAGRTAEPDMEEFVGQWRLDDMRRELTQRERALAEIDAQCAALHVELNRLHLYPERLEADPDAPDHFQEQLDEACEVREQAAAECARLRAELEAAERRHVLGWPPVPTAKDER